MTCTTCGAALPAGATFCPNCGARTAPADAPAPQAPPAEYEPRALPPLAMPPETAIAPAAPPSYAPAAAPTTSTTAIISLVFGILGVIFALPLIGPLVAVVAGHMARNEIRRSEGRLTGDGMAVAGLIMGYLMLALSVLAACAGIAFFLFIAAAASSGT